LFQYIVWVCFGDRIDVQEYIAIITFPILLKSHNYSVYVSLTVKRLQAYYFVRNKRHNRTP
jgi:hypothetical protein